ncbi:MAG: Flagellar biosynthesis protein FliS [Thermoanaerobacterales bacterium 50_218]|nr:MAG: Flagellar biosynthesis protein FliS [Thermoanaerobacterales bacterium 50_218]
MAVVDPYSQYRQTQVLAATPERLVLMLYEGAIRFLGEAKVAIAENNLAKAHEKLVRAQDIFTELQVSLNMDYEISKPLASLYDYFKRRLIEANVKKDVSIIDEILELVRPLKDAWAEVCCRKAASQ